MNVSVLVHGNVLALLALLALVLGGMHSDSRVAREVALSYWIFWGLQAVLSSALFPWLRKSPLRYGLGSLALVPVSAVLLVMLILGGLFR